MNRNDFQALARLRLREARILLREGEFPGAYYLAGYSIECAIKACIAKQTRRYDFPSREIVQKSYTHNLGDLLKAAGLQTHLDRDLKTNSQLETNWAVVKDWSELARYEWTTTSSVARDLYSAISSRKNGVLPWLRKYW
jgi:HEPN domain-containing protein